MIVTERLDLIPATAASIRAALQSRQALGVSLDAVVPDTWPPEFLDEPALRFTLDQLEERPQQAGWWMYFAVLARGTPARILIGSVGYKGPPADDGTVELGYGIVRDHHRRGYATESVRALLARAFAVPAVSRVIAETMPELIPSIGVLRKCGFRPIGNGSEAGVIRFEIKRDEYSPRKTTDSTDSTDKK